MKATRTIAPWLLALAAPAAMAQGVTLAGRMDMAVQHIDDGVTTTKRADSGTYTASRLIVRGNEDLGGGLGALFYLEHRLAADTGNAASAKFWNAGSYVGLSGKDWGTITLGRQYVPIFWPFLFGDDTGPLRLHTYSAVQTVQRSNFVRVAAAASPIKAAGTLDSIAGGIYSLSISSAFEDNLVVYKTPSLGGLTLTAAVAPSEGYPAGGGKVYGGNAEYRNGPLYAGYAFNQKEGRVPAGGFSTQKVTEHVVTAMYTVSPAFNVWGNVHPWKFTSNGAKLDGHDWMIGGTYKNGPHWVWANYATKSIGSGCTNCDSSGFGIGYHYLLSKKSELYVSWASVSNEANSANTLNGFAPGAVGKDLRGLAAGIAVTF
jgi:predicted porin